MVLDRDHSGPLVDALRDDVGIGARRNARQAPELRLREEILKLGGEETRRAPSLVAISTDRIPVIVIYEHTRQRTERFPAALQPLQGRWGCQRQFATSHGVNEDATVFRQAARQAVDAAVSANVLHTASGIEDHSEPMRLEEGQRREAARRGVRKAQDVAIEHAV